MIMTEQHVNGIVHPSPQSLLLADLLDKCLQIPHFLVVVALCLLLQAS